MSDDLVEAAAMALTRAHYSLAEIMELGIERGVSDDFVGTLLNIESALVLAQRALAPLKAG